MLRLNRNTEAVWLLGLTQIIGYGSLYYSFAILSDDIAREFGWSQSAFFGVFSAALIAGGAVAPHVGRACDRFGAARVMAYSSVFSALALFLTAWSPQAPVFIVGLVLAQVASTGAFYDAAFTALVQLERGEAQRRIVFLTLIAGFASTVFWPLTSWLDGALGWRMTLLIYGTLNLLVCAAIHGWLARHAAIQREVDLANAVPPVPEHVPVLRQADLRRAMILVTAGFALGGFALSAVISQMVPMLEALGFGAASLAVSALFGPAQVIVRFTNMVFGSGRHPLAIAVVALSLLPLALFFVGLAPTWSATAIVFVVLVGLCSGLKSIVQGTVPLALFGSEGYGARLGRMASARYVLGALAPFGFAALHDVSSAAIAAMVFGCVGLLGVVALLAVARMLRTSPERLRNQ